MQAFLFAVNAVIPIMLLMVLGFFLKKIGLMGIDFSKQINKVVYRVFLPVMLFLNIYKIESFAAIDFGYVFYTIAAVFVIFLVSIPLVCLVSRKNSYRGVLLQATFRSNYAFIGIPLAQSLFGDEGVVVATLLSAIIVPFYNVLATVSLSIFRGDGEKISVKKILLSIIKNPLIQSIFIGLLALLVREIFVATDISFRLSNIKAIYTPLNQLSSLATPLALISLGAQFEFSAVSSLKKEIIFGTVARSLAVPLLCIGLPLVFAPTAFSGAHYAAFVAAFATPVAVSTVPMAQEMDGDIQLAGQLVVWSTLFSAFTVFFCSLALKLVGVF